MKLMRAAILLLSIVIACHSQFKAHMKLSQLRSQNNEHHNLQTLDNVARNYHHQIFHNHQYIHKQLQKSKKQHNSQHKSNLHSHRITQPDHQILQTYNLLPNMYSFSLQMKVAGIDYKMQIDSGSSDIFIKGEKSIGEPKIRYQCGQTCIKNNEHYELGYLDGHVQTYEKQLEVELGDMKFNQSILVAYKVQNNFKDNQGLVGLSYQELSENPHPTFLQTLKNQHIIDAHAFGVNLNFQDETRSFITFGNYDNSYFQGSLDLYSLTSNQFYYIDAKGFSFGNGNLLPIRTALFDTGNTCISIPNRYQKDILAQFNVKGNKCYFQVQQFADMFSLLRCKFSSLADVPTLNIQIGTKTYKIQKEYYLQACDRKPKSNYNQDPSSGVWYCDTYIESVRGMNQLFLGDGFFSRFYTYFDLETKQVGIAKNKQIITIQKIISNRVDASPSQWKDMLKNLDDGTENSNNSNNSSNNGNKNNNKTAGNSTFTPARSQPQSQPQPQNNSNPFQSFFSFFGF